MRHICCRQGQLICPCQSRSFGGVGPGWTWMDCSLSSKVSEGLLSKQGRVWKADGGSLESSQPSSTALPSSLPQQPSSADFLSSLLRSASYCQGWWSASYCQGWRSAIPHHLKIIIYGNLPLKERNHFAGTEKRNIETTYAVKIRCTWLFVFSKTWQPLVPRD